MAFFELFLKNIPFVMIIATPVQSQEDQELGGGGVECTCNDYGGCRANGAGTKVCHTNNNKCWKSDNNCGV